MKLYLIRHAIAAAAAEDSSDADRPLTREGVKKFRRVVKGFMRLHPPLDVIFCSPYVRARQTAGILAQYIESAQGLPLTAHQAESLAPPGDVRAFLAAVARINPAARGVAAVGHEPILSAWIAELCGDGHGRFEMKKGAIAGIELTGEKEIQGELFMLAQPTLLRALGAR